MNFLTRFSLKNPAAIIIIVVLITLGGVYSALNLKKETMPDINVPVIAVITPYPGASPNDILEKVTKPIENSLMNIKGIDNVSSTTNENSSAVVAQFSFSADMEEAKKQVDEAVKKIKLPEGAIESQVTRISFDSFPVLKMSFSNANLSTEKLEKVVTDTVLKRMNNIEGVGQAQLASHVIKSVSINLKPDQLKKYNLTYEQINQQLQVHNLSIPTGKVTINGINEPVKVNGEIKSIAELKNLQIPIFPNPNEQMEKSFKEIGNGIATLGQSVGQLGSAVGQMGQGMVSTTQALNAEIQLSNTIQDTQTKVTGAKLALKAANLALKTTKLPEKEKLSLQQTIQDLTQQVEIGDSALKQMNSQLKMIQDNFAKMKMPNLSPSQKDNKKEKQEKPTIKLVALEELAEIKVTNEKTTAISRIDGENSVVLNVLKSQEANTVDATNNIKSKIGQLKESLPVGTKVKVIFDQSTIVKDSINSMLKEGAMGAIFACIVILIFLRNIRSTIISIISIPLSILIALLFLKQLNITLNVLTLGALAIAVGRVVDDSIVVIENVYRHLQKSPDRNVDTIKIATKEVTNAITSSTVTTIAVFLPLGLVNGMVGILFKPFAFTVVIALLASLFVAVTIVPMLSKFFLLKSVLKEPVEKKGKVITAYQRILKWSLNHKFIILLIATALFAGSITLLPFVGTTFMPKSEEKYVNVEVRYPDATDINITDKKVQEIEKILDENKNVVMYQTTVGSSGDGMTGSVGGSNRGSILVQLTESSNVKTVIKVFNEKFKKVAGDSTVSVAETSTGGGSTSNSIDVTVTGTDVNSIKQGAETITSKLKNNKNLEKVSNVLSKTKPEISIEINQKKAAKEGLSAGQVGTVVRQILTPTKIGSMTIDKEQMDINIGLKLDQISKLKDIKEIELKSSLGKKIKLQDIAEVKEIAGPVTIYTKNGEQHASVKADITGKNTGKITQEVQNEIDKIKLPNGVHAKIGGTIEQMNDSFKQLGIAIAVAIGTVYLVMVIAFGEAKAPFAILFSLPLAMIGGVIGLYLVKIPLDMPAMIGFLMLIGIVVTNAIVLIDRVQHQRENGIDVRDSLIEAGTTRMRPILMTALATIGALSPLAFGLSKGSIMSQSLAVVVISGLITSTLLTLIIVPVIFELLTAKRKKEDNKN